MPLVALLAAVACGGSDPRQLLQQVASAAASAQLALAERASGAIPRRYATQVLEKASEGAAQAAAALDEAASLPHDTKARATLVALQVSATAKRAASDTASAPVLAQALDSLAHDARWLADHTEPR